MNKETLEKIILKSERYKILGDMFETWCNEMQKKPFYYLRPSYSFGLHMWGKLINRWIEHNKQLTQAPTSSENMYN